MCRLHTRCHVPALLLLVLRTAYQSWSHFLALDTSCIWLCCCYCVHITTTLVQLQKQLELYDEKYEALEERLKSTKDGLLRVAQQRNELSQELHAAKAELKVSYHT
jgi:septal ring factor EnvC (AmiA/AmiB activator)